MALHQIQQLFKNPTIINKIEYWAATTAFILGIFFLIAGSTGVGPNYWRFQEAEQQYSYFGNYFLPMLVRYATFYSCYLVLSLVLFPSIMRREQRAMNIGLTIVIFGFIALVLGITDTWIQGYMFSTASQDSVYEKIFTDNLLYSIWLLMMFAIYNAIKLVAIYLLENSEFIQSKYRVVTRDGIYAFIVWMIGFFLMLLSKADPDAFMVLGTWSLCGIFLYCYSMYALLPEAMRKKSFRFYIRHFLPVAVLASLPVFIVLLFIPFDRSSEGAVAASFFNVGFQLLFTAPLSWYVYKHRMTVDYEIRGLQTALGQSTADLNFLRSQINPHFLFNVLNTLYGTALQENAERTAGGIQKLGDMMRFMLRENLQEKISLAREIEYLNNYINLQTLRTQTSPDIVIETNIEDHLGTLQIAPMLLIPFVENAFKHGISLKERSIIRINLGTRDNTLFFDVSNSLHPKPANDPEKDNNGIGLSNVRQRLRLIYPGRHELSIRESDKEYFVHLTIQLA